jgi:hypothetical protein
MVNEGKVDGVKVRMGVLEEVGVPPPPTAPTVLLVEAVEKGLVWERELEGDGECVIEGGIEGVLKEEGDPLPPPPEVPVPELTPEGVEKGGLEVGDAVPLPLPLKLAIPVLLPKGLPDMTPVGVPELTRVELALAEPLEEKVSEREGVGECVLPPVKDNTPLMVPPPIPGVPVTVRREEKVVGGVPLISALPEPPPPTPLDEVGVKRRGVPEEVEEGVAAISVEEGKEEGLRRALPLKVPIHTLEVPVPPPREGVGEEVGDLD